MFDNASMQVKESLRLLIRAVSLHEAEILKICDENQFILSTGGGTPCFKNNLEVMNENGISIFLNTSISVLIERIKRKNGFSSESTFDTPCLGRIFQEESIGTTPAPPKWVKNRFTKKLKKFA